MRWIFLITFLGCFLQGNELHSSTSVIIPCYHSHFQYLAELLEAISNQTELPEEVIISLSESEKVEKQLQEELKKHPFPFKLQLLTTDAKKSAGENRNIACRAAKGDVVICQDADDLPHKQRVEIINYFFDNYPITHLLHRWVFDKDPNFYWGDYNLTSIPIYMINDFNQIEGYLDYVTNGNCAFRKSLISPKLEWTAQKGGEDVNFNVRCIKQNKSTGLIDANLLIYRNHLSSH